MSNVIVPSQKLTSKQEMFCLAYVELCDKSAAYRRAYSCANMKLETVNRNAYKLFHDNKITTRIKNLQNEVAERNKVTIDQLVQTLAEIVRFDIADMYDESGNLLSIHEMPKVARQMIHSVELDEINVKTAGQSVVTSQTKRIKILDKLGAIEKLMKHLGGYEKDNGQKKTEITVIWNEEKTYQ